MGSPHCTKTAQFQWTRHRQAAALALAQAKTNEQAAQEAGIARRTLQIWLNNVEFRAEVDRLSLMVGIASRAERLRIAMRVAHQKVSEEKVDTDRDLLDWLKFAQSETDGAKLDLAALLGAMEGTETGGTENRTGSGKAHGGTR